MSVKQNSELQKDRQFYVQSVMEKFRELNQRLKVKLSLFHYVSLLYLFALLSIVWIKMW